MNKITVAIGLVAALALPATAAAKPSATQEQKQAAHAQCKLERGKTKVTHEAFKAKYHSMSRCVRQNTAEEAAEEQAARANASKECKAEAADPAFPTAPGHEGKSFAEFYGANANDKNAHGKCVSAKAKAKKAAMDEADAQEAEDFKNAAKACAEERRSLTADVFANKYGTNPNKRNAFGKCVSKLAASDA